MALLISRNTDSEDLPIACMLDDMPCIMQCSIQGIGLLASYPPASYHPFITRCMLRGLRFILNDEDKVLHDFYKTGVITTVPAWRPSLAPYPAHRHLSPDKKA